MSDKQDHVQELVSNIQDFESKVGFDNHDIVRYAAILIDHVWRARNAALFSTIRLDPSNLVINIFH